jgi:hypothetical protein
MNPQTDRRLPNAAESLDTARMNSHFAGKGPQEAPEFEVWEPPFERWLRMADDLLRDWQHTLPEHRA